MTEDDLIIAFFPCTYFSCMSQMLFSWTHKNYVKLSPIQKADKIIQRSKSREHFFKMAVKLHAICHDRGLRLIMENPWSGQTFLKSNFLYEPTIVDTDRTKRGDYFVKPTAYWFVNCTPEKGSSASIQMMPKDKKSIIDTNKGIERSFISPEYARNFIDDFILGTPKQHHPEQKLLFQ